MCLFSHAVTHVRACFLNVGYFECFSIKLPQLLYVCGRTCKNEVLVNVLLCVFVCDSLVICLAVLVVPAFSDLSFRGSVFM